MAKGEIALQKSSAADLSKYIYRLESVKSFPNNISLIIKQTKPCAVGTTHRSHLSETILFSTRNIELESQKRILEHSKPPFSRALRSTYITQTAAEDFENICHFQHICNFC